MYFRGNFSRYLASRTGFGIRFASSDRGAIYSPDPSSI